MNRFFIAGCVCCLLLVSCSGMAGYRVRTVEMNGTTFMMVKDIAGFYQLSYAVNEKDVTLRAKGADVRLSVDRRVARLNGVEVNLCFQVVEWRGAVLLSEPDFRLVLDPVLRPQTVPRSKVRTIMLDAGHGGKDQGTAVGPLLEKDITLRVLRQLARSLQRQGFTVKTTRAIDRDLTLEQRSILLDRANADLFISLHVNSAAAADVHGIETFLLTPRGTASTYSKEATTSKKSGNAYDKASMRLAFDLQRNMLRLTGSADRGIKHANFAVLREATAPAVLVELGFLSNAAERRSLSDATYIDRLVDGLVSGVSSYRRSVGSP